MMARKAAERVAKKKKKKCVILDSVYSKNALILHSILGQNIPLKQRNFLSDLSTIMFSQKHYRHQPILNTTINKICMINVYV